MTVPLGMVLPTASAPWVSGIAHLAWVTVAKRNCGTSDRHTASRVPGPNGHLRRSAPAANSLRLRGVLQSSAHALGITERCTLASSPPMVWCHCRPSHLGRGASAIRLDMIFGKDGPMSANDPKQTRSLNSCVCISYASISGTLHSEVCLRVVNLGPCTVVVVM